MDALEIAISTLAKDQDDFIKDYEDGALAEGELFQRFLQLVQQSIHITDLFSQWMAESRQRLAELEQQYGDLCQRQAETIQWITDVRQQLDELHQRQDALGQKIARLEGRLA